MKKFMNITTVVDGMAEQVVHDMHRIQYENKIVHFHKEIKFLYYLGDKNI